MMQNFSREVESTTKSNENINLKNIVIENLSMGVIADKKIIKLKDRLAKGSQPEEQRGGKKNRKYREKHKKQMEQSVKI